MKSTCTASDASCLTPEQGRTLAIGVTLQHILFGLLVVLLWRAQDLDARFAAAAMVLGECFLVAWNLRAVRVAVGRIRFAPPGAETFAIMRGASAVLVARLPRMLFYQGDIVLVSWLASAAAAGEYVAGQRIVLSLAMIAVLVQWGVFPHASRLAVRDRAGFFSFQCAIVRYLLLALVPVSILGFVYAPDLVQILYGPAYAEASGALRWLFCALPVFSVSLIVQDSLFALHRNTTVMIVNSGNVFDATSSQQNALAETFRIFPTFLDESKATFAKLESFSRNTRPLIRELRPVLRDLVPTLRDVRALAPDLKKFFHNLDPRRWRIFCVDAACSPRKLRWLSSDRASIMIAPT